MVFSSTKVANIGQQGIVAGIVVYLYLTLLGKSPFGQFSNAGLSVHVFDFGPTSQIFNQLRWLNMSAHLTKETSYWLKKLLVHIHWAIHNVCDLNIDLHVCFFLTLSQDRAWPIPLAQPEACPQRSERPVRARSPHRSRNGYPGWDMDMVKISQCLITSKSNKVQTMCIIVSMYCFVSWCKC